MMHSRAQRGKDLYAACSDGWSPKELKTLPLAAWTHRENVIGSIAKQYKCLHAYHAVYTPMIPKKGKGSKPLNHKQLAVLTGLYRIEAGAWFTMLMPWFR